MGRSAPLEQPPAEAGELLVPLTFELSPIRQLLLADLDDDPVYATLEPQLIEDPAGDLLILLAYRHDGLVELYVPAGRDLDPLGYTGLHEGLGGSFEARSEQARFDVTADGLQLDVVLTADNGRRFDLHLHERLPGPRDRIPILAPVGGSFEAPEFFPFLWLPGLSFLPVRHCEVEVRIDGQARSITRLPVPLGGRRCLMARYDPEVQVCLLNPDHVQVPPRVPARVTSAPPPTGVEVVQTDAGLAVAGIRVGRGGHTCAVRLEPPLPDLRELPVDTRRSGSILLQADGVTELRGRYGYRRTADQVELVVGGFGPWRTRSRRPVPAALFRLPLFRRWPATYRWRGRLELTGTDTRFITSRWSRRA